MKQEWPGSPQEAADQIPPESAFLSLFGVAPDRRGMGLSFAVGFSAVQVRRNTVPRGEGCACILGAVAVEEGRGRCSLCPSIRGAAPCAFLSCPGIWRVLFPTPRARARNDLPTAAPWHLTQVQEPFQESPQSPRGFCLCPLVLSAVSPSRGPSWAFGSGIGRRAPHVTPRSLLTSAPWDTEARSLSHNVPRLLT